MASDAGRTRGLGGQGLAVLLGTAGRETPGHGLLELPLNRIQPNPRQPRARLDEEAFAELVASVRRDGIVQPIVVRRSGEAWELIAGERRWRAAQAAGLTTIPAVERQADDRESLALALVENLVRSDLNPVEHARAYVRLQEEFGLTQAQVAEIVGRSRPSVANAVRLLDLPDDVLPLLEDGSLTEGHGRALLQVADHEARRALAREAVRKGWSVRRTEAAARRLAGAEAGAAGKEEPRRRRATWFDVDLANDAIDGMYRIFGAAARVDADEQGCRIEVRFGSSVELARFVARLDALEGR